MGCVYLARCKVNGKCYVGKTVRNLPYRRRQHERDSVKDRDNSLVFRNALRKYGLAAFDWYVLAEDDDPDWILALEKKWIKKIGSLLPNGYNMTEGGQDGRHAEETVERIRSTVKRSWQDADDRKEAQREQFAGKTNVELYGEQRAKEIADKIREAHLGTVQTPESNAKRSQAMTGRPKSPEAIENMKLACASKTEEARRNSLANLAAYNEMRSSEGISEHTRKMLKLSHLGNQASEETKAKMREAQKRRRERERTVCSVP
jgi:group I intron endonuclease